MLAAWKKEDPPAHRLKPVPDLDIFVIDFISLAQHPNLCRARRTLLHTIDHVFRPLSAENLAFRSEPVSLKKLRKGDFSWNTGTKITWKCIGANKDMPLMPQPKGSAPVASAATILHE